MTDDPTLGNDHGGQQPAPIDLKARMLKALRGADQVEVAHVQLQAMRGVLVPMAEALKAAETRAKALEAERDELLARVECGMTSEDYAKARKEMWGQACRFERERDAAVERAMALEEERDEARKQAQWFVEKAADEKLDGYRELGQRAANAENERDAARRQLAEAERERDEACREVLRLNVAHTKLTDDLRAKLAVYEAHLDKGGTRVAVLAGNQLGGSIRPKDVEALEEWARGITALEQAAPAPKPEQPAAAERCPACNGFGSSDSYMAGGGEKKCTRCGGAGRLKPDLSAHDLDGSTLDAHCRRCGWSPSDQGPMQPVPECKQPAAEQAGGDQLKPSHDPLVVMVPDELRRVALEAMAERSGGTPTEPMCPLPWIRDGRRVKAEPHRVVAQCWSAVDAAFIVARCNAPVPSDGGAVEALERVLAAMPRCYEKGCGNAARWNHGLVGHCDAHRVVITGSHGSDGVVPWLPALEATEAALAAARKG